MTTYRYKILNMIKFFIVILSVSMLISQNLELFMQKTTLENSLRDKIYSEVGHIIDKSKFVVVVNLELSNNTTSFNNNESQSLNNQITDLAVKGPSENSMDFIVGLPLSNANKDKTSNDMLEKSNEILDGQKNVLSKFGSMNISKISVNFFLEESIASPALDKTITTLVNGIIPMIANCDDCISLETMQFQKSSEKSELEALRERIESMERQSREEELSQLDQRFEDLQDKLFRSEEQREMWEEQAILDREFQRRQDSLRLVKLEANEDAERVQLDTLLLKAQQKIDTVINARIESETETKKDLIDIIKYGQGNLSDKENQGILGMKGGGSSDSTLIYLGFGAIIFCMFMLLFFKKNKQEVVYLKPKGDTKKKTNKENKKNKKNDDENVDEKENAEATTAMTEETLIPQAPTNPYATMAFEDENVIRAELKALRQSAVSMSANQREGATQIVKDWLSDNASEGEPEGDEG